MKTIGFIGAHDKTDFMIYVAKVLTVLGKRVLMIDNTLIQKARYIVPVINPTKAYVTEFEKIDVSVGFDCYQDIKRYLGTPDDKDLEYDIILIDVDSIENFERFHIDKCYKNYFVTSFDLYSLKKGLEILSGIEESITLTKILFSKDMLKEDDEYLNYLSSATKIIWNDDYRVYLPLDSGDQSVIIENQRVAKAGIRKLSSQYKENLQYVVQDIMDDIPEAEIKKVFKLIEKEV